MTTVFLDAVFKPFFKIVHDTGQQLTIDRTNFLVDGFLQIIQRTGFVSVNTRFQIPPKKKIKRWNIGRAKGPRHVSETGNEVPGKHISNNGHWLVCSVRCGTILLKPHIGTVYSSSAQFWVLPTQKMSGSRGSPFICGPSLTETSLCGAHLAEYGRTATRPKHKSLGNVSRGSSITRRRDRPG